MMIVKAETSEVVGDVVAPIFVNVMEMNGGAPVRTSVLRLADDTTSTIADPRFNSTGSVGIFNRPNSLFFVGQPSFGTSQLSFVPFLSRSIRLPMFFTVIRRSLNSRRIAIDTDSIGSSNSSLLLSLLSKNFQTVGTMFLASSRRIRTSLALAPFRAKNLVDSIAMQIKDTCGFAARLCFGINSKNFIPISGFSSRHQVNLSLLYQTIVARVYHFVNKCVDMCSYIIGGDSYA